MNLVPSGSTQPYSAADLRGESLSPPSTPSLLASPTVKRLFDIGVVLAILPFALPVCFLIAAWVRLVSRGTSIYRQERVGRNGEIFEIYKFRTMKLDAGSSPHMSHFSSLVRHGLPMVKMDDMKDQRLIRGACFLRSSGLDELPQLWNVLKGNMSLVGPRPCLAWEYSRFYKGGRIERFNATPGVTGLWQVSGKNSLTFDEMVALDIQYSRERHLGMDILIILRTPVALLRQMKPLILRCLLLGRKKSHSCSCSTEKVKSS